MEERHLQTEKDPCPRKPESVMSRRYLVKKGEVPIMEFRSSDMSSLPMMLFLSNITEGDTYE